MFLGCVRNLPQSVWNCRVPAPSSGPRPSPPVGAGLCSGPSCLPPSQGHQTSAWTPTSSPWACDSQSSHAAFPPETAAPACPRGKPLRGSKTGEINCCCDRFIVLVYNSFRESNGLEPGATGPGFSAQPFG